MIGSFAIRLETPDRVAHSILSAKLFVLYPVKELKDFVEHIEMITVEDVQRVARKYLDAGSLRIVAVGDRKVIEARLSRLKYPVTHFDGVRE